MKRKNIAFILFAVAGLNLITIPLIPLIFTPLYEAQGMPSPLPSLIPTIINNISISSSGGILFHISNYTFCSIGICKM